MNELGWRVVAALLSCFFVGGCTSVEERAPTERLIGGDADFSAKYALIGPGSFTRTWYETEDKMSMEFVIDRPFYLKRHEVTVREWMELMDENPSPFIGCGLDCPVVNISWYDGIDFMNKMSIREGLRPCYRDSSCEDTEGPGCRERAKELCPDCDPMPRRILWMVECDGYRYPSEPEWQHAAQGGKREQDSYIGPLIVLGDYDSPNLDTIAVYGGNSGVTYEGGASCFELTEGLHDYCGPAPVGTKLPNAYGLYDMMGNVHEWTWGERLWGLNPKVDTVVNSHVRGLISTSGCPAFRGCAWSSTVLECFLESSGSCVIPTGKSSVIGLRPARTKNR